MSKKDKQLTPEQRAKLEAKLKKLNDPKAIRRLDAISNGSSKIGAAMGAAMIAYNKGKALATSTPQVTDVSKYALIPSLLKMGAAAGKKVAEVASSFSKESELESEEKLKKKLNGKDEEDTKEKESAGKKVLKAVGKAGAGVTKGISTAYALAAITGLNPIKKGVDLARTAMGFSEDDMNDFEITFNVDKYLTEDFSSSPSKHRFAKQYAKNILPGALVMLGVTGKLGGFGPVGNLAGKLMSAKVMSVYSTPDGRLSLELLPVTDPKKDGQLSSGLRVALTEQVSPNEVLTIQNPYGRGMGAATPAYYSETQFAKDLDKDAMFSEIQDSYDEYSETMDEPHVMKEIHEDLLHIGMSDVQINELLEEFATTRVRKNPKTYKEAERTARFRDIGKYRDDLEELTRTGHHKFEDPDKKDLSNQIRKYNIRRWGIDSDRKILTKTSEVGLVPAMKAGINKQRYGENWHDIVDKKQFEKQTQKYASMIAGMIDDHRKTSEQLSETRFQNTMKMIQDMPDGPAKKQLIAKLVASKL